MLNPLLSASAILMLLAAPAAGPQPPAPQPPATDWNGAVALMGQHVVIHVPQVTFTARTTIITRNVPLPPVPPPSAFVERKAKDCVRTEKVVGYVWTRANSLDLVLSDGKRLRARLGADCPAIAFYGGFYIRPNPDGKMCAGRDILRSRSGGACGIQEFKSLVPAR